MFCSAADVKRLTGYTVTPEIVIQAQTILEVYVGRTEDEIEGAHDLSLMGRAAAFQAAYMSDSTDMIYEQIAAAQIGQNDSVTTFRAGDDSSPWVAPLARMACKNLSWKKSRSIHTGRIFQKIRNVRWTAE